MKITNTIAISCSIAVILFSGCASTTYPAPEMAPTQAVANPVDAATKSLDKLMQALNAGFIEQITNNQIGIERSAADSIQLTFSASGFKSGKSVLSQNMKMNLNALTNVLDNRPDNIIHIIGYTDSSGKQSWNQKLSEKRAIAVTDHLISMGQDARHIVSQGLGEFSPVADNATKQGRALNRRIEIYVRQIIKGKESLAFTPPI